MLEVPGHGGLEPLLEVVTRLPAQFAADTPGVDGIATVMAGPVRDPADQGAVGSGRGCVLIQLMADRFDDLAVGAFPVAADAIAASCLLYTSPSPRDEL